MTRKYFSGNLDWYALAFVAALTFILLVMAWR